MEYYFKGTIIRLKNLYRGEDDSVYCLVDNCDFGYLGIMDCFRSMGSISSRIKTDIPNAAAVSKEAIIKWVIEYVDAYYDVNFAKIYLENIDSNLQIEHLSGYFKQVNRDIKV